MKLKKELSATQLMALLWAGMMAPAAELLPSVALPVSGRGAWLSTVAALPLVLGAGWLLKKLAGNEGLAEGLLRAFGTVIGTILLFLYIMCGVFLLALRLRLCAQRLLDGGDRDGALWFFLLVLALLTLWMARGKLSAVGRTAQVFLGVLLVTAAVVLGLSLPGVRGENLFPLWKEDVLPVAKSGVLAAAVLSQGGFAAFLLGYTTWKPQRKGTWLWWGGGGCLLLTLAQMIAVGNFGPTLADRLASPFFTLAKSVGVEGAFQRVESVVTALWVFSDLALMVMLLWAIRAICAVILPKVKGQVAVTAALLPAAVIGLAAFPDGFSVEVASRGLTLMITSVLTIAIPALGLLIQSLRGEKKQKGTSCG